MTALSSETLSSEFISSDLCPIADENLASERITDLQVAEGLSQSLKHGDDVSVVEIEGVNLAVDESLQGMDDKRLSNIYITLPLASVVKYSMNYICRICACVGDSSSVVNIFSTEQFQHNLAGKINKYLPIVVYETDPFPKTVCNLCFTKLNQFHDLAERCVVVEEQLRQTYAFDDRYLEELNKKMNVKADAEMLKSENSDHLYSVTEFEYMESLEVRELGPKSPPCKEASVEVEAVAEKSECLEMKSESAKPEGTGEKGKPLSEKQEEEGEEYPCSYCEYFVSDVKDCFRHWERHYGDSSLDRFPCILCSRVDGSKSDLEVHLRTHFDAGSIAIAASNSRDKTKARQQKLLRSKSKSKAMRCRKCKESLESADVAIEHCLNHKPPNVKFYPCVLCVNGIGKSKLRDHVSAHYPLASKSILACDNCNNLYPDEKTLKYHRCTKLRKFKCSQCKQGFKSEDRLKFHEDFHRNKSTFCDICKKDFKFESRIYLHFAGVHNGIREKPYCCDVCGKTFTWLTLLDSHKRTHTNERPFKCTKCDARFCNKYSLNGHMPSHEDHPQMYCDKCDYHTGRKQNLQNHVSRFHREIDSSQTCIRCSICSEVFPNMRHADVESHSSRHAESEANAADAFHELTVTKLYQCERCERCFASVDDLARHRVVHADSDSNSFYQCRLCDSSFAKHDLLVKHRKVHVRVTSQYDSKLAVLIVISCDICGMECVDYRQLLNHKDRANCMMKKITGTLPRPRKVLIKKHLQPLRTHQLFVNSSGLFECPSCQRTYKNRRRYRLHLATHSN